MSTNRKVMLCAAVTGWLAFFGGICGAGPLSTPQPIGKVEDLTVRHGGILTDGAAAHWSKARPEGTSEHVAARQAGTGALFVFSWGASAIRTDNLSSKSGGAPVAGPPVAWPGSGDRENVAAISATGTILVFTRTPTTDWTAVQLPVAERFSGHLASWVTPTMPVTEHLAAITTTGAIRIFLRQGATLFAQVPASQTRAIPALRELGGAWSFSGVQIVEHLVALGQDGKLYDLSVSALNDWTATAIPLPAGHTASTDLTGWLSGRGENVALRTTANALLVLTRPHPGRPWTAADLTGIDEEEVTGRPAPYVTGADQDAVAVRGRNGQSLVFWNTGQSPLWQILNLTELSSQAPLLEGEPAAWGPDVVAGSGPDGHLRVLWAYTRARELTEELSRPFQTLRTQTGTRKTLTILWNPETNAPNCTAATGTGCLTPCRSEDLGQGTNLKFDRTRAETAMSRIGDYFQENSGGLLAVTNDKTLGWFTSNRFAAHYTEEHGPGHCADGWSGPEAGALERRAEAIRQADAADPALNFNLYDTDGNKILSADELAVILMIPGDADAALTAPVLAENGSPLVVDGVTIPEVTEIRVASAGMPQLGLIARELSRRLLGLVDMSWTPPLWPSPPATALGALTPMDRPQLQGHLDAFTKLKLGWLRPRIVWQTGTFSLKDVETRHSARVLLQPSRGTGELLLFENRFRGTSFDQNLPAGGLAVYHVLADPAAEANARPPFYIFPVDWNRIRTTDWGHRTVRLIPPVVNRGFVSDGGAAVSYLDSQSLWTQAAGYDLEPFPTVRGRAWWRWADGVSTTNPGVALRSVSAAGREMTFALAEVPTLNPAFCASLKKNCGSLDDGLGGRVECGTCQAGYNCSSNVCTCVPNVCEPGYCGQIDQGCGLGPLNCFGDDCPEGWFCVKPAGATRPFCKNPDECPRGQAPCACGPPRCPPCTICTGLRDAAPPPPQTPNRPFW